MRTTLKKEYDDNVLINAFIRIIDIIRLGNYSQAIRMLVSAVLCHIEVFHPNSRQY